MVRDAGFSNAIAGTPGNKNQIALGHTNLAFNEALALTFCNDVAEKTKAFWSLSRFKAAQSSNPVKPEYPEFDDFEPHPDQYTDEHGHRDHLVRVVLKADAHDLALNDYAEKHQSYQKLLFQTRLAREAHSVGSRGYLDFVFATVSDDWPEHKKTFFFRNRAFFVDEASRKFHTFICGGTGSGKSQSILNFIKHYLEVYTKPAMVVLDPHGDLAKDVAKFKQNATNDRLVYVKPGGYKTRHISFNPFDIPDSEKNAVTLNQLTLQYYGALEELLNMNFSDAQRALVKPCLSVILHRPNSSFLDLARFMNDDENADLIQYGANHLPNEEDANYFKGEFQEDDRDTTKSALRYRLRDLIREPIIQEFLCRPSTFNLGECIQAGKIIVFDFDPKFMDPSTIKALGQLIVSYIYSFTKSRDPKDRLPCHVFLDEFQYFVNSTAETVLGESRKYNMFLTMATQRTDQVGKILDAVLGNVGVYLVGRNRNKTAETLGKELEIGADAIRKLNKLQFYQSELERPPAITKIPIVGHSERLNGEDWLKLIKTQLATYYRSNKDLERKKDHEGALVLDELGVRNKERKTASGLEKMSVRVGERRPRAY